MNSILVVNAGSSSLKFQVFTTDAEGPTPTIRGQLDGIGTRPRLRATRADNTVLADQSYEPGQVADLAAAAVAAGTMLREKHGVSFAAVGHRVVHGGPVYERPVLIDDDVLSQLERFAPLAPPAPAEQSRTDPRHSRALPEPAPGRVLRYRVPSRAYASGELLRHSATPL
jgi:acetate kinase